jgi:hypothetical protein
MTTIITIVMTLVALSAQTPPPAQVPPAGAGQQSSSRSAGQSCTPATDPDYGLTPEKAVQIGGGAMYVGARERRYLDSLKGPGGQALTYRRTGTTPAKPPNGQLIDTYEVTWEGAEKPVVLFLFAYLYGEPKVPTGFTCSGFTLGTPPIDGFMAREQRAMVAVTQGATTDFPPISLDVDGSAKSGVAFDSFRMIARVSRAAAKAGRPLDPQNLPARLTQQGLVLVAYPKRCGETLAVPKSIDLGTPNGVVQTREPYVSGTGLATLLPGVMVPEGSLAALMPTDALKQNEAVRVMFDETVCEGESRTDIFRLRSSGAKGMVMPEPTRPEGIEPPAEPVWLQAVVDLEGRLLNAQHVGGPGGIFVDRARDTLRDWRAEPARINGSPVVADTHVVFAFKK